MYKLLCIFGRKLCGRLVLHGSTENRMRATFRNYLQRNGYDRFDIKAVLFDMDGVLYDSMPEHVRSWQQTMEEFGFKSTRPRDFYLHEGRTGNSTINLMMQREFGRDATQEEVRRIYARKAELFARYHTGRVMTGAREVLEWVRSNGLTPVLVTGSGQPSLLERLNDRFPGIFTPDTMVTAFDVKNGKPHPEPFLMGLKKGGNLQPNQALVVENAPLGTEAAHRAKIFTITVNTGPLKDTILKEAGADVILPSMPALYDRLPDFLQMVRTLQR